MPVHRGRLGYDEEQTAWHWHIFSTHMPRSMLWHSLHSGRLFWLQFALGTFGTFSTWWAELHKAKNVPTLPMLRQQQDVAESVFTPLKSLHCTRLFFSQSVPVLCSLISVTNPDAMVERASSLSDFLCLPTRKSPQPPLINILARLINSQAVPQPSFVGCRNGSSS